MWRLRIFAPVSGRRAVAALVGALAQAPARPAPAQEGPPPAAEAPATGTPDDGEPALAAAPPEAAPDAAHPGARLPDEDCLARTLCSVKDKIRWRVKAWKPETCQRVARGVLASARAHDIDPTLLVGIMINESDMNEKAVRITKLKDNLEAKDSGLMGVRCILGKHDRCLNGNVRDLPWKDLMDPVINIEMGARELAYWRDGGAAVTRVVKKRRDEHGRWRPVMRDVPCTHKTHAWWAHYNHGPHYIAKGFARHYPHRIAVLANAVAKVMNVETPGLRGTITMQDPGRPPRTLDKPVETRHRKLCAQIRQASGTCSQLALAREGACAPLADSPR